MRTHPGANKCAIENAYLPLGKEVFSLGKGVLLFMINRTVITITLF